MSTEADLKAPNQAGSKSQNKVLFDPWEKQAAIAAETPIGAPKGTPVPMEQRLAINPWERYVPPIPRKMNINETEQALAQKVTLSPAEQRREDIINQSPGNIAELKQEIASAKNPKIKAILQAELDKLTRK